MKVEIIVKKMYCIFVYSDKRIILLQEIYKKI